MLNSANFCSKGVSAIVAFALLRFVMADKELAMLDCALFMVELTVEESDVKLWVKVVMLSLSSIVIKGISFITTPIFGF